MLIIAAVVYAVCAVIVVVAYMLAAAAMLAIAALGMLVGGVVTLLSRPRRPTQLPTTEMPDLRQARREGQA